MNSKTYKAYAQGKKNHIFMDGPSFLELVMQKGYDDDMYTVRMAPENCYFVPKYSFENAMARFSAPQQAVIRKHLSAVPTTQYQIFEEKDGIVPQDEEVRVACSALDFKANHPNMRMEVSSHRIMELYRIASVQKVRDSDLL